MAAAMQNVGVGLPTKIKMKRLGINISEELNRDLDLQISEYLIIGEHFVNYGGGTNNNISMIVDTKGFAINSTFDERRANSANYAAEIHGSTLVDGNLVVNGTIILNGNVLETGGGGNSSSNASASSFWRYSGDANNIYYDGNTTFGNIYDSRENQYVVNISENNNFNINYAQFALQNRQNSILRMAIIGEAQNSPIIFNTESNTPIEFHVNRRQDYFETVYRREHTNCACPSSTYLDVPNFRVTSNYPHLNIDINGNVGIKTNINVPVRYILRQPVLSNLGRIVYPEAFLSPDLQIEGTTYSRNILLYDYETGMPKNLDELYVRKMGETIYPNNLIPGRFAKGNYTFLSNLSIFGPIIDDDIALAVNGVVDITSNLIVHSDVITDNLLTHNNGAFSNNVLVQNNIYLKGSVFKEYYNEATGSNEWGIINLGSNSMLYPTNSNIYSIADGLGTQGRMGVGLIPSLDELNHQSVIMKRDASYFELELSDKSRPKYQRSAFIGHPRVSHTEFDYLKDASLVFLTPNVDDDNFNNLYARREGGQQHIYFFPGWKEGRRIADFVIESNNVPTMGIFTNNRVGINTYTPTHTLDVNGDVAITGAYYLKPTEYETAIKMGIWVDTHHPRMNDVSATYGGIQYINPASPHVGINMAPSEGYGLSIMGKTLSVDGYYTSDNFRMVPLLDSCEIYNKLTPAYDRAYINGRIGIGVKIPDSTLNIRDTLDRTRVKLSQGAIAKSTILQFNGTNNDYAFHLKDDEKYLELFYGDPIQSALEATATNRPFLTHYNVETGVHQFVINSNMTYVASASPDTALMVKGNVEIDGDINVTGAYKVSGSTLIITAGEPQAQYYNNLSTVEDDNIYLAGNDVYINTNVNNQSAVYIGWRGTTPVDFVNDLLPIKGCFYVKQTNPLSPFVMKTKSGKTACLNQFNDVNDRKLLFGINDRYDLFFGKEVDDPYLVSSNNSIGIGGIDDSGSKLHIYTDDREQRTLSIMRFTGTPDADDFVANLALEKTVDTTDTLGWTFQGPNYAYNQKLQFMYRDNDVYSETMCLTSNGCLGIGKTNPKFAIDILYNSNVGSIRIAQPEPHGATAQLLFQCHSNDYGTHLSNDYRFFNNSNNFRFESANVIDGARPIFHFGSNNVMGIHKEADPRYAVSIEGRLNVTESIFINERSFFSVSDTMLDSTTGVFEWENIVLNPEYFKYGGVSINSVVQTGGIITPTSNIFQINTAPLSLGPDVFDGNGNMAVFNSGFSKSYIHYKNVNIYVIDEHNEFGNKNIVRAGLSNLHFITEFRSNVSPTESFISDLPEDYVRFAEVIQSPIKGEFIETKNGYQHLNAINPRIIMNNINTFGTSNDNMYIVTSNLGIGKILPNSKVDILNENDVDTMRIRQLSSTRDIMTITRFDDIKQVVINKDGNVGIGTTKPTVSLHVVGGKTVLDNRTNPLSLHVYGNSIFSSNMRIEGKGYIEGNFEIHGNLINDSDSNIKHDIRPIEDALAKIQKLSGYTFYKNDLDTRDTGVIAQEVQAVLPEAVFTNTKGVLGVAYGNLVGLLIEGIKDLTAQVATLRAAAAD